MQEVDPPTTTFEFDALRGVGQVELRVRKNQRVYALFGSNGVGKTKCLEALFQFYLKSCETISDELMAELPLQAFVARRYAETDGFSFAIPLPSGFVLPKSGKQDKKHHKPVVFLGASQRSHITSEASRSQSIGTFEARKRQYFYSLIGGMQGN
ncbi:MAG: hypothetical protein V4772_17345, partial [Pseudomonadota bacterium]